MKYTVFFMLALMGWNSWGLKFACKGRQARYQQLQWEVQNYEDYDSQYKANIHRWLAYCEMEEGTEIKRREAVMHAIALNCTLPGQTPTEQRPPCSNIKTETTGFAIFFEEEWLPQKDAIQSG